MIAGGGIGDRGDFLVGHDVHKAAGDHDELVEVGEKPLPGGGVIVFCSCEIPANRELYSRFAGIECAKNA